MFLKISYKYDFYMEYYYLSYINYYTVSLSFKQYIMLEPFRFSKYLPYMILN